jgi:hypothetical protein
MHGYRSLEGTFLGGCLFSGRNAGRAVAKAAGEESALRSQIHPSKEILDIQSAALTSIQ